MNSEHGQNRLTSEEKLTRFIKQAHLVCITLVIIQLIFTKQLLCLWHCPKCWGCSNEQTLNLYPHGTFV